MSTDATVQPGMAATICSGVSVSERPRTASAPQTALAMAAAALSQS